MPTPEPTTAKQKAPVGACFCDVVVLLLAGWTLVCNAVVHAGGRPVHLAWASAAFSALSLVALARALRGGPGGKVGGPCLADDAPPATPEAARAASPRARALLALLGAGCLGLPFPGTGFFVATAGVGLLAVFLVRNDLAAGAPLPAPGQARRADGDGARHEAWALWLLSALAVAVTLCAHRRDRDDAFYLGLASSLPKYPGLPLLSFGPMHGEGWPLQLDIYRVHSLEPLAGLLSWATGIPVIYFMHVGLSALGAMLVVLGTARLFRYLLPRRWPFALAALLAIYLLDGGRNQGYANFAFVRLFQGKALYASALVPLTMYYGLRFGRAPTRRGFVWLSAVQIAALGCTASALPSAPMVAGLSVLAAVPWSRGELRRTLRTLLWTALSSAYLLGTGIYFYLQMHAGRAPERVAARAVASVGAEVLYRGVPLLDRAYQRVLGEGGIACLMLGLGLVAAAVSASGAARRIAAVMGLCFFGLLANPYLTGLLSGSVFGAATFWRIFWVLPLPLLAACVVASVGRDRVERTIALAGFAGALLWLGESPVLSERNQVHMGPPGQHAPADHYAVAHALTELVPVGAHVAAETSIAIWIPAQPRRAHPVYIKKSYMPVSVLEMRRRRRLTGCLGKKPIKHCSVPFIAAMLDRYHIQGVALRRGGPHAAQVRAALRIRGMHHRRDLYGQELWTSEARAAGQEARR